MTYKDYNIGDWIGLISGAIEDMRELDGNEMRDLVEFLTKQKSVIEDIKAEIEHIADYTYGSTNYDADLYNGAYKDGLYEAIDVIDKHISGKEQE